MAGLGALERGEQAAWTGGIVGEYVTRPGEFVARSVVTHSERVVISPGSSSGSLMMVGGTGLPGQGTTFAPINRQAE
jgi:hypothetical protein